MLRTGPDGALWVADMYRAVIEHPEYIPVDWQKRLNVRAGDDMGRIYRVYPVGQQRRARSHDSIDWILPGWSRARHTNGWQRDMAQQMLVWRADKEAVPLLKKVLAASRTHVPRPAGRCPSIGSVAFAMHARWPGGIDEATLLAATAGSRRQRATTCHPFVRKLALRDRKKSPLPRCG